MPRIRQEIDLLRRAIPAGQTEAFCRASGGGAYNPSAYSGVVSVYLEIVATNTVAVDRVLWYETNSGALSRSLFVPALTTAPARIQGEELLGLIGEGWIQFRSIGGDGITVRAARLVIIQDATEITATETVVPLGFHHETFLTTYDMKAAMLYWLYDAAQYDPAPTATFEAFLTVNDPKYTASAALQRWTGAAWVNVVEVSTSNTGHPTRLTAPVTLVDGSEYRVDVRSSNTMGNVIMANAGIRLRQSSAVQKLETVYRLGGSVNAMASANNTDDNAISRWDPAHWTGCSVAAVLEVIRRATNMPPATRQLRDRTADAPIGDNVTIEGDVSRARGAVVMPTSAVDIDSRRIDGGAITWLLIQATLDAGEPPGGLTVTGPPGILRAAAPRSPVIAQRQVIIGGAPGAVRLAGMPGTVTVEQETVISSPPGHTRLAAPPSSVIAARGILVRGPPAATRLHAPRSTVTAQRQVIVTSPPATLRQSAPPSTLGVQRGVLIGGAPGAARLHAPPSAVTTQRQVHIAGVPGAVRLAAPPSAVQLAQETVIAGVPGATRLTAPLSTLTVARGVIVAGVPGPLRLTAPPSPVHIGQGLVIGGAPGALRTAAPPSTLTIPQGLALTGAPGATRLTAPPSTVTAQRQVHIHSTPASLRLHAPSSPVSAGQGIVIGGPPAALRVAAPPSTLTATRGVSIHSAPAALRLTAPRSTVTAAGQVALVIGGAPGSLYLRSHASQVARPGGDISAGGWTAVPLWSKLNEVTPDDGASMIVSASNPANATFEVRLSPLGRPQDGPVTVAYRYSKSAAGGRTIDIQVRLVQGSTEIATGPLHASVSEVWTDGAFTLTPTQIASITDWTDLRLRGTANVGGSGGGRSGQVTWMALFAPQAVPVQAVSITGPPAALRQSAPPSTITVPRGITITSPPAVLRLAAPPSALAVPGGQPVTIGGAPGVLRLAAPHSSLTIPQGVVVAGAPGTIRLSAPLSTLTRPGGVSVAGAPGTLRLSAPPSAVTVPGGILITGAPGAIRLTAPPSAVGIGQGVILTGRPGMLRLAAPLSVLTVPRGLVIAAPPAVLRLLAPPSAVTAVRAVIVAGVPGVLRLVALTAPQRQPTVYVEVHVSVTGVPVQVTVTDRPVTVTVADVPVGVSLTTVPVPVIVIGVPVRMEVWLEMTMYGTVAHIRGEFRSRDGVLTDPEDGTATVAVYRGQQLLPDGGPFTLGAQHRIDTGIYEYDWLVPAFGAGGVELTAVFRGRVGTADRGGSHTFRVSFTG